MAYAEKTSVPIERSKTEIEKTLQKYGATSFMFATQGHRAMIVFEIKGLRIKFALPLPNLPPNGSSQAAMERHNQLCRSKWRSLLLCIKAKLESVEAGITTIEQEFLAHIVLPNQQVVGDFLIPQIESTYKTGRMPPLLGSGS